MAVSYGKPLAPRQGYDRWLVEPGLEAWLRQNGEGEVRFVHVFHEVGRRRERVLRVANKTQAKAENARLRGARASGDVIDRRPKSNSMTLNDLWAEYSTHWDGLVATRARSAQTWSLYGQRWASHIEPVIGRVLLSELGPDEVVKVTTKARAGRNGKGSSLAKGLEVLMSSICEYAIESGYLTSNPVKMVPRSRKVSVRCDREVYVPSDEEVRKLVASASSDTWRLLIDTLASTGLRISECLGLQWGDIDTTSNVIQVTKQLDKGTGCTLVPLKTSRSTRTLPLPSGLRANLLEAKMASLRKADTDYVFAYRTGKPVGYRNARRAFDAAVEASGIKPGERRLSPHSLRWRYGSVLLLDGLPVDTVSKLMGHSNPTTTLNIYADTMSLLTATGELAARVEAALAAGGASS